MVIGLRTPFPPSMLQDQVLRHLAAEAAGQWHTEPHAQYSNAITHSSSYAGKQTDSARSRCTVFALDSCTYLVLHIHNHCTATVQPGTHSPQNTLACSHAHQWHCRAGLHIHAPSNHKKLPTMQADRHAPHAPQKNLYSDAHSTRPLSAPLPGRSESLAVASTLLCMLAYPMLLLNHRAPVPKLCLMLMPLPAQQVRTECSLRACLHPCQQPSCQPADRRPGCWPLQLPQKPAQHEYNKSVLVSVT